MKNIFLLLSMLFVGSLFAKDLAKVNIAILRNNQITHGKTCMITKENTNVVYEDALTYVEADIVEITNTHVLLRCLISTAAPEQRGMLVVRGMPRILVPLNEGLGMTSLNCDGKDEHFMLIVSVCPC